MSEEMLAKFLLVVTLSTVISCSIGHEYYVQRVKPQMLSDSSLVREPLVLASSTNGSTLEDILQELDTRYNNMRNGHYVHINYLHRSQLQSSGCHFSAGTYGGGGGAVFNELPNNCGATIKRMTIRDGSRIDAIQITYRLSNGQDYTGGHHGGNGGRLHTIDINVDEGERVIGVFGKYGREIDQLGFVTSWGRTFGPCGGLFFKVNSCLV